MWGKTRGLGVFLDIFDEKTEKARPPVLSLLLIEVL
jgi:hypothetical protein